MFRFIVINSLQRYIAQLTAGALDRRASELDVPREAGVWDRHADVFFYGLLMDAEALRSKGYSPSAIEVAAVRHMRLQIGERATLVESPGGTVYGVVMSLSLLEIERLYTEPGFGSYQPQAVIVELKGGGRSAALCYVLPFASASPKRNSEYVGKLRIAGQRAGLPTEYLASLQ